MNKQYFSDFLVFSYHQINCRDVDPMYDVLKALHNRLEMTIEQRIHHVMFYLTYYNIASSQKLWNAGMLMPQTVKEAKHPTGIERRGFRDGMGVIRHLCSLYQQVNEHATWEGWITQGWHDNEMKYNWTMTEDTLQRVWGNGRWASYKGSELLQKVCGMGLMPFDMGHEYSSGPRKGLALLYPEECPSHSDQSKPAIRKLNELSDDLHQRMIDHGINVADIGEVETCCCDFHSLVEGRYYVGHDIDHMQESLYKADELTQQQVFQARGESLPINYLGECTGRQGVDKERCTHYKRTGEILWRE